MIQRKRRSYDRKGSQYLDPHAAGGPDWAYQGDVSPEHGGTWCKVGDWERDRQFGTWSHHNGVSVAVVKTCPVEDWEVFIERGEAFLTIDRINAALQCSGMSPKDSPEFWRRDPSRETRAEFKRHRRHAIADAVAGYSFEPDWYAPGESVTCDATEPLTNPEQKRVNPENLTGYIAAKYLD